MFEVLKRLRHYNLYSKIEKCVFETNRVEFLVFIIRPSNVEKDPQTVEAILNWPIPQTKKQIKRFVGFANFYRKYIRNFSAVVQPLTNLKKKDTIWHWSSSAQKSIDTLKYLFTTTPVLHLPDPKKPYVLEVDASDTATGAIR
ncbi:uncharacterized protein LOC128640750 [Bombina bombina]|uniref:uncharacterized protein LOC128640750 n=1 Tax=Bombina bombina TaxID=8345 RepID=UPI00235ADFB0|nr:uncharacterized protein LOC128640750 [Bombina bombina]